MDVSELIKNSWKITRDHKVLWFFGFLNSVFGFLFFPLLLLPLVGLFGSEQIPAWMEHPLVWLGWGLAIVLFMVLTYLVSAVIRAALVLGVHKADHGAQKLSFGELLRESRPFFWRFLGLMMTYALTLFLVSSILSGIQVLGAVLTMGLATICLTPLSYLLYPLLYAGLVWMELSETAMVMEGLNLKEGMLRGWQVVRQNVVNLLLIGLIMYLGIGLLAGVFMIPMIVPFFVLPFTLIESDGAGTMLLISGLCLAAYFPIFAIIQGITIVFMKAGWYLAYVRLTQGSGKPQTPMLVEPERMKS